MRRVAFWATVAGVSLISPYVLGVLARRFPKSPVATLNTDLKRT
ncbi:MAG: hypothetical protein ACLQBX_15940 [Candidatus Limnocylindrales bacterium]